MENSDFGPLIVMGIVALAWLAPIIIILFSSKTTGGEKFAWLLAVFFISWFAWIFYFLLAPIKQRNSNTRE